MINEWPVGRSFIVGLVSQPRPPCRETTLRQQTFPKNLSKFACQAFQLTSPQDHTQGKAMLVPILRQHMPRPQIPVVPAPGLHDQRVACGALVYRGVSLPTTPPMSRDNPPSTNFPQKPQQIRMSSLPIDFPAKSYPGKGHASPDPAAAYAQTADTGCAS